MAAKTGEPGREERPGLRSPASEDRLLLARVVRQDGEAFRLLVARHLGSVLRLARRMLRDDAEAEDVAQEAMLRVWRAAATLEIGPLGLRPWLLKVASNLCLDRLRAGRRLEVTDEVPEVAEEPVQFKGLAEQELSSRVEAAIQALPERQRLALTLFHFEGLSQIETGAMMGISDEAVESLLARARRSLKAVLRGEWQSLIEEEDV